MEYDAETYGKAPVIRSRTLSYTDADGSVISLNTLGDLAAVAARFGIAICDEVASQPATFAELIASYLSLGTVLRPTWRYLQIQEQHDIDLTANQPRVEGGSLRFLAADLRLGKPHWIIQAVTVNLTDLATSTTDLYTLR
jgi:hypothetical protein